MKALYTILLATMLLCVGCQWQLKSADATGSVPSVSIERYDRLESQYLTTGDLSALRQMNITYPMQTRMLIEELLHLGKVDDEGVNQRFLQFYQDSTLQQLLADVASEYADMDDIDEQLSQCFMRLKKELPSIEVPFVYTQIGSFDQSIVVMNNTLGISLDKYLGRDYPFYQQHYSQRQREMMVRQMIVPDCLGFYLLSLYPIPQEQASTQSGRDDHMGRIQWVVNRCMRKRVFSNEAVERANQLMHGKHALSVEQLLQHLNPSIF